MRSIPHRSPVMIVHHGRTAATNEGTRRSMEERERAEKQKNRYITFICRLLARMDLESLEKMLDAAIDEIR